ncbi:hypothetical protein HanXRQr2_Chr11g0519501 [Helianthus annuus]|uniref:Uncharacterized protein n=1 Tax=Helianthus annuus TaxID=4232 RepID=A0A9K3HTH6_HELAN|nr:hypothetical protein HanXRQr2_Chr11g0519501 [Helianthus annuus]KAJ0877476.1 hypothetical protein HanPSC8_Chr11g0500571 [Helianthus annuus]
MVGAASLKRSIQVKGKKIRSQMLVVNGQVYGSYWVKVCYENDKWRSRLISYLKVKYRQGMNDPDHGSECRTYLGFDHLDLVKAYKRWATVNQKSMQSKVNIEA